MSADKDRTAAALRVIQQAANKQGDIEMLRLAESIANDAALVRIAQAEALRTSARRFVEDMAPAWGGGSQWLTTGTRVAEVVACVLREWATDIELSESDCSHEWLDRPESDTRECLICGTEVAG
jgi:hypothetical protein